MEKLNLAPGIRPLRTEEDYDRAVAEVNRLLDLGPEPGSAEDDRLELLTVLVEAYDKEHFEPEVVSTPQTLVQFALEQQGRTRADLEAIMGSKGRVSDFLNGRRTLSRNQMLALRRELGIPVDLLIGPSEGEIDPQYLDVTGPILDENKEHNSRLEEVLADFLEAQTRFLDTMGLVASTQSHAVQTCMGMISRLSDVQNAIIATSVSSGVANGGDHFVTVGAGYDSVKAALPDNGTSVYNVPSSLKN